MSGLVIVLTLPVNEEEGHRPYLSQSAYPAKGTTVGGRTDDPRRERTRDALARHRARAGAGQRQRGVPRAGDLADRLLSLAQPAGTLRGRRRAPAPAARPGGASGGDGARSGAAGARDRDQRGHLGVRPLLIVGQEAGFEGIAGQRSHFRFLQPEGGGSRQIVVDDDVSAEVGGIVGV